MLNKLHPSTVQTIRVSLPIDVALAKRKRAKAQKKSVSTTGATSQTDSTLPATVIREDVSNGPPLNPSVDSLDGLLFPHGL